MKYLRNRRLYLYEEYVQQSPAKGCSKGWNCAGENFTLQSRTKIACHVLDQLFFIDASHIHFGSLGHL